MVKLTRIHRQRLETTSIHLTGLDISKSLLPTGLIVIRSSICLTGFLWPILSALATLLFLNRRRQNGTRLVRLLTGLVLIIKNQSPDFLLVLVCFPTSVRCNSRTGKLRPLNLNVTVNLNVHRDICESMVLSVSSLRLVLRLLDVTVNLMIHLMCHHKQEQLKCREINRIELLSGFLCFFLCSISTHTDQLVGKDRVEEQTDTVRHSSVTAESPHNLRKERTDDFSPTSLQIVVDSPLRSLDDLVEINAASLHNTGLWVTDINFNFIMQSTQSRNRPTATQITIVYMFHYSNISLLFYDCTKVAISFEL